jgi:hypothetical protein
VYNEFNINFNINFNIKYLKIKLQHLIYFLNSQHHLSTSPLTITSHLQQYQAVTTVRLAGCNIGSAGAEFLGGMLLRNKSLTRLDIPYNDIGSLGAAALAEVMRNEERRNGGWRRLIKRDV